MDHSVAELFVILAINPDKGRVTIDSTHFRYSLTGAILMDYLDGEEFKIENKRVVPSLRINEDAIHILFTERIMRSSRNRKISFWVRTLTRKFRFVFSEMTRNLERKKIIRIEQKRFLNILPYKRYWFINKEIREKIIEDLREVLIHGRHPDKKEFMLLGIVEASRAYGLLSRERGEVRILGKKNTVLLQGDIMSSEINQAIKEVQASIVASVVAVSAVSHGGH